MEYRFLEPVDVLYLRGNRLFGDAGAHGEALMPPWPSMAAGSLRSRMLVDARCDPREYGRGRADPAEPLKSVLGTPDRPGSFRVSFFTLGRSGNGAIEPCFPVPADVAVRRNGERLSASLLHPCRSKSGVQCGSSLPLLPILRSQEPFKPESGVWLSLEGMRHYLQGRSIPEEGWVPQSELWRYDVRLGIALNAASRSTETGRIYTAETVALAPKTGFLVGVSGADGMVPSQGMLRFGGDGRAVRIRGCSPDLPEVPWDRIAAERRFRLVVTSPGVFSQGWVLPGCRGENGVWVWEYGGLRARLVAASVKRQEVVSGWDLALQRPKDALRAVPAGSVYWLEGLDGGIGPLKRIHETGLWDIDESLEQARRRAEGFNGVWAAAWPKD